MFQTFEKRKKKRKKKRAYDNVSLTYVYLCTIPEPEAEINYCHSVHSLCCPLNVFKFALGSLERDQQISSEVARNVLCMDLISVVPFLQDPNSQDGHHDP